MGGHEGGEGDGVGLGDFAEQVAGVGGLGVAEVGGDEVVGCGGVVIEEAELDEVGVGTGCGAEVGGGALEAADQLRDGAAALLHVGAGAGAGEGIT